MALNPEKVKILVNWNLKMALRRLAREAAEAEAANNEAIKDPSDIANERVGERDVDIQLRRAGGRATGGHKG